MLGYEDNPLEYFQSDLFDKNEQRQQGHRAWEDEKRWTVQGNLSYSYPYSKTGLLESGYQYHSYLEDGDYTMQFWNLSIFSGVFIPFMSWEVTVIKHLTCRQE